MEIKGGDQLEKKLAELANQVTKPGVLKVGFLEGATYPDGKPVAMIAAIQEFGAPSRGIPPRPYFRNMIALRSPNWGDAIAVNLKNNDYDAEKAMNFVGEGIKGQLQQSIIDTNSPPLSPTTVRRKGFDKPLIDTGHMLNSVDYNVTSDGETT